MASLTLPQRTIVTGLAILALTGCGGSAIIPPQSTGPAGGRAAALVPAGSRAATVVPATPPASFVASPITSTPSGSPAPSSSVGQPGASASVGSLPSPAGSPAPSTDPLGVELPFDEATAADLQRVLDAARLRIPTPGISVAIRLADGRTWIGVSGYRQLSPARPVDEHTVFSIASITKTFVTAVVMQLVAEGRLGLDDRLARYLPDYPRAARITIRELLGHTSGIANYFLAPRYNAAVFRDPTRRWTTRDILRLVGAPVCAPGRCFEYSNTNFVLLGEVIRRITGHTAAHEIRTRLLDPLDLEHTSYQPVEATSRDAAHGHLWAGGSVFRDQTGRSRVLPMMSAATVAGSAGAMVSDAADLARWALALYSTDRVVPPELRAQMLAFRKRDEYGLGTRTRIFNGRRAIGHGGSLRGYEDGLWYFPREGAVIVLLSNRGLYDPDRTIRQLARTLWRHIEVPDPELDPGKNTG